MTKTVSAVFILWGYKPGQPFPYALPLKLTAGSVRHCRAEQRMRAGEGWSFGIYRQHDAPVGLRLQAQAASARSFDVIEKRPDGSEQLLARGLSTDELLAYAAPTGTWAITFRKSA